METRSGHQRHLAYRPEIDGLRAIAVLAVIFFHAGANLPGGFVGVDIFYVISGFLITKIIVTALQKDSFSFLEFYARRIKRLLPAALAVLLATLLFGYFILVPHAYVELAKSAVYASVFLANVWFSKSSGYFDASAEVSPLVHMWSLAVEEQFYLFFPLILVLSYKAWKTNGVRLSILSIFSVSIVLSLLLSNRYPDFSFYLLPTRAWELCIGAMLVFLPMHKQGSVLTSTILLFTGAVLVICAVFFVSEDNPYPGWLALLPVVGSALLIVSAHSEKALGNRLLSWSPLVLIGKFSYSAYLWHWPIVVYYRVYVSERSFHLHEVAILIFASVGAGYLSWRYIEERFRYSRLPTPRVLLAGGVAVALMFFAPLSVYFFDGYPGRVPDDVEAITDSDAMWDWTCAQHRMPFDTFDQEFCVVGDSWENSRIKGIIWGDSHSLHWAPVFHELALERGISLLVAPEECPPYLDSDFVSEHYPSFPRFTEDCTLRHRLTMDWLRENSDVSLIIMAAAWSGHVRMLYTNDVQENLRTNEELTDRTGEVGAPLSAFALRETLAEVDLSERRVLLLGDMPRPNRNLNDCAFAESSALLRAGCTSPFEYLEAQKIRSWHRHSDSVLEVVASEFERVEVIIPVAIMCDSEFCPTFLNGELLYRDSNHIRRNLDPSTIEQLAELLGIGVFLDNR